ncbi:MAG: type I methionyl aminopeptidase [Gammaproteobacteria bacterium]|nr:type I methionyl aminopeptidase [Gammaproteobacteria bacterium]
MRIQSERDIEGLRAAGRAVARTLAEMLEAAEPGMSTATLDAIGASALARQGARSAPRSVYDFPGETCISINEEAAHGVPGERILAPGDVLNVDVSAVLDGYFGDTGATIVVPPSDAAKDRLCAAARGALDAAMDRARAGARLNVIGRTIETVAREAGFTTLRDLGSHGVGRSLHEDPRFIPNFHDPLDMRRLRDGMVITIEPFVSTRTSGCTTARDGWTLLSGRGNLSAQCEHTLVIRDGAPLVMTLP